MNDLIGVPFVKGGRDRNGLDCWGLCREVYQRIGGNLPEYGSPDLTGELIEEKRHSFVRLDAPEKYCLVLFRVRPPYATHIGIMLDGQRFIHCSEMKRQVCIERITHPLWAKRIEGFYRWQNSNS